VPLQNELVSFLTLTSAMSLILRTVPFTTLWLNANCHYNCLGMLLYYSADVKEVAVFLTKCWKIAGNWSRYVLCSHWYFSRKRQLVV